MGSSRSQNKQIADSLQRTLRCTHFHPTANGHQRCESKSFDGYYCCTKCSRKNKYGCVNIYSDDCAESFQGINERNDGDGDEHVGSGILAAVVDQISLDNAIPLLRDYRNSYF